MVFMFEFLKNLKKTESRLFMGRQGGVKGQQKSNLEDGIDFYFRFGLLAKKNDSKLGFFFFYILGEST